jgi:hypothetical protein
VQGRQGGALGVHQGWWRLSRQDVLLLALRRCLRVRPRRLPLGVVAGPACFSAPRSTSGGRCSGDWVGGCLAKSCPVPLQALLAPASWKQASSRLHPQWCSSCVTCSSSQLPTKGPSARHPSPPSPGLRSVPPMRLHRFLVNRREARSVLAARKAASCESGASQAVEGGGFLH